MPEPNDEGGLWAVVSNGDRRYIGLIATSHEPIDKCLREQLPITLKQAWSVIEMDIPTPTQGGLALQHVIQLRPPDGCVDASTIRIIPSVVHLFKDMTAPSRNRHKELVAQAGRASMEARADRAGIKVAPLGAMPHGPNDPPRL